jgi:trafficking protein particle complex subunit 9
MILSIYNRPTSNLGEVLPQLAFSEVAIRMAKMLTAINITGGVLTDEVLQHLVKGSPLGAPQSLSSSRLTIAPTRTSIANLLLRAMPEETEIPDLSPLDRLGIFGAISSVFSALGLQRKKALLMKDFLEVLVEALTQSKIAGAAEAGLHPAASLSALSPRSDEFGNDLLSAKFGDSRGEAGLEKLLNILCQVHGIPESTWSQSVGYETQHSESVTISGDKRDSLPLSQQGPGPLPNQLVGNFVLRSFGSINVKADVLRACIQLCEALGDVNGILHYTSALLRTAGPGIALKAESNDVLVTLSREEQISLANSIIKTVADAKMIGYSQVEAEFWDEFLVRGIFVLEPSLPLRLHPQSRTLLEPAKTGAQTSQAIRKGPFLHDAFAQKTETKAVRGLLVSSEEREFVVSLQNPYEFDLEIESLRIVSDGQPFASSKQPLVLRSTRTQSFSIMGKMAKSGSLRVDGCLVKAKGCRERFFPIFVDSWAPEPEMRMKNIGLLMAQPSASRPASHDSIISQGRLGPPRTFPLPSTIPLTIIPPQPVLVVADTSIQQGALMILEGEKQLVTISVKNVSSAPANFVLITCQDSLTSTIQEAIVTKGLSPADLFAMEDELAHPALKHLAVGTDGYVTELISPEEVKAYTFEITGRPGLTTATITFDYGNVSEVADAKDKTFYTRQISVPLAVTVNASVQIHRCDVIPLMGEFAHSVEAGPADGPTQPDDASQSTGAPRVMTPTKITPSHLHSKSNEESEAPFSSKSVTDFTFDEDRFSLLVIDLRNVWPTPLSASVGCLLDSSMFDSQRIPRAWSQIVTIQPGHIERLVLPVPKLYIENAHMSIMRALRSANERQFVVSATAMTPDFERTQREMFWYRQMLLRLLSVRWIADDGSKLGDVSLNQVQLSPRMLQALKLDDVAITMDVVLSSPNSEAVDSPVRADGANQIKVHEFATFRTRVHNRSSHQSLHCMLRLRPAVAHQQNADAALDLAKRLAWSGLLQQRLKPLGPGESVQVEISLCAFCSGDYEVMATVDEVKQAENTINEEQSKGTWDDGLFGPVLDSVAESAPKRSWTGKQVCRIVAMADD